MMSINSLFTAFLFHVGGNHMIRKSRALLFGSIAAWLVAVAAFAGGWASALTFGDEMDINTFVTSLLPGQSGPSATPKDLRSDFQTFWDVWGLVKREFYHKQPLEQKKMVYGAIRGMLQSLGDDYTVFQEPDAAAQSREHMRGTLEGIGTYLRIANGEVVIDRPIKNSPAEKAGLLPGDVLMQVDGVDMAKLIKGMKDGDASAAAASKVRGDKGSVAKLVVRRPPATTTFTLDIVRDAVPLISVNGQLLDSGVAYVQISEFKSNTNDELNSVLRDLLPKKPTSIVLDLRNNPGGFLQSAQEVLGHFYSGVALYEIIVDGTTKELKTVDASADTRRLRAADGGADQRQLGQRRRDRGWRIARLAPEHALAGRQELRQGLGAEYPHPQRRLERPHHVCALAHAQQERDSQDRYHAAVRGALLVGR